jgi:hypothetical protein
MLNLQEHDNLPLGYRAGLDIIDRGREAIAGATRSEFAAMTFYSNSLFFLNMLTSGSKEGALVSTEDFGESNPLNVCKRREIQNSESGNVGTPKYGSKENNLFPKFQRNLRKVGSLFGLQNEVYLEALDTIYSDELAFIDRIGGDEVLFRKYIWEKYVVLSQRAGNPLVLPYFLQKSIFSISETQVLLNSDDDRVTGVMYGDSSPFKGNTEAILQRQGREDREKEVRQRDIIDILSCNDYPTLLKLITTKDFDVKDLIYAGLYSLTEFMTHIGGEKKCDILSTRFQRWDDFSDYFYFAIGDLAMQGKDISVQDRQQLVSLHNYMSDLKMSLIGEKSDVQSAFRVMDSVTGIKSYEGRLKFLSEFNLDNIFPGLTDSFEIEFLSRLKSLKSFANRVGASVEEGRQWRPEDILGFRGYFDNTKDIAGFIKKYGISSFRVFLNIYPEVVGKSLWSVNDSLDSVFNIRTSSENTGDLEVLLKEYTRQINENGWSKNPLYFGVNFISEYNGTPFDMQLCLKQYMKNDWIQSFIYHYRHQ